MSTFLPKSYKEWELHEEIQVAYLLRNSQIPEHMHGAIVRYIVHGINPGDFLTALINNDLKEACACADDINRHHIFDYVKWFYNHAPSVCWGYDNAAAAWSADRASSAS